ncbi:MAG: adenylate cyclase class 2 [Crocinitomicaceae bacterium]|jgi:adenylate cyclase class 2
MNIRNHEFKASVENLESYEKKLLTLNPIFHGIDLQKDTYFNAKKGRLKLREGNIENSLINYQREDIKGSKESTVVLYKHSPDKALKDILELQLGVLTIVEKKRKIYFIDTVKFHFDQVEGLGFFIEVEAIDDCEKFTSEELKEQCDRYYHFFELDDFQLIDKSYSDLIVELSK